MPAYRKFLLGLLLVPCWIISFPFDVDLRVMHGVGRWLYSDLGKVYNDPAAIGRFFYGPIFLLLLKPVGYFSYPVAQWIWLALQTASYVIFWWALLRLFPVLLSRKSSVVWWLCFITAINPIHNNFQSGNIQLMLAAALLTSEVLYEKGDAGKFFAGVVVMLAAAIKIFPIFIVGLYLLRGKRSAMAGLAAGALLSVAVATD